MKMTKIIKEYNKKKSNNKISMKKTISTAAK